MKRVLPLKLLNTEKMILQSPRDNWSWKNHWVMVHPKVITIVEQTNGKVAKGVVNIPKKVFESIIKLYETGKYRQ